MKVILSVLLLFVTACQMRPVIGQDWIGRNSDFIEKMLGRPVVTRTEGNNKIAAYRVGECSILVFFDSENKIAFVDYTGSCEDFISQTK